MLKSILNSDYNNTQSISEIIIDNNTITDMKIISERFNEYFINVNPPNLAKKIPKAVGDINYRPILFDHCIIQMI